MIKTYQMLATLGVCLALAAPAFGFVFGEQLPLLPSSPIGPPPVVGGGGGGSGSGGSTGGGGNPGDPGPGSGAASTPEPATITAGLIGIGLIAVWRRKKK